MTETYDTIGVGYDRLRRPDPRIAMPILHALGDATTIVNVGAGAGSYEPRDRRVVAVEPSVIMIRQRPSAAAPVIRASSVALPFRDGAFDAALAVLTLHHWPDWAAGLREMRRVARRRVVLLTWDPASTGFWLSEYLPEMLRVDRSIFPSVDELRAVLGRLDVVDVPVPHDCSDGFMGAYWRRPQAYLDPGVRATISTFARLPTADDGLARLSRDLASGAWRRRFGDLLARTSLDLGYRLVIGTS